ncbi:hypothetical protein THOKLE011_P10290 (plasmid) [Klebsiella michiganensis]|nr:hypothetical protein THOKLE011_P10290 [Klebsiella michiganensis]
MSSRVRTEIKLLALLAYVPQSGTWGAPKIQFTTQTYNIAKNTRNLRLGVHAYCSWTYLNGSPFGGFQQVYSDQNNVWYVSNYAWGKL